MIYAGLVALNALFLVGGLGILWGLRGWSTWRDVLGEAGLAWVLGLCGTVVPATLVLIAGGAIATWSIVAIALGVAAVGASVGYLRRTPIPRETGSLARPRTLGGWLAVIPAALAAFVSLFLFYAFRHQPLLAYDAWNFWVPKAKTIYFFGGLDAQLFRTIPAPSYPIFLPTLDAMTFHLVGAADPSALALEYWFLLVGFLGAAASLLARIARRGLVWLFLAVVAVVPEVEHRWFQLIGDWPLDVFFALSALLVVRWLYTREAWLLGALPFTAAAMLATKREGQLLAAALLLGVLAATRREWRRLWPVLLGLAVVAYATTQGPWRLWWSSRHLKSDLAEYGIGHVEPLSRLWPSLKIVGELTFDYRLWLLAVPLALVSVLLAASRREHRPAATFSIVTGLIAAAGFTWVIWSAPTMPLDTNPALNPTVREVGSLALLSLVVTPVALTALLSEVPLPALDLSPRVAVRALPTRAHAWILGLEPRAVLIGAVVAQWAIVLGVAAKVRHAGWLYYQGGDQLWYYTSAWVIAHGHMPWPAVGYLWSILLAPLALVGGPDILQVLPAIIILEVVVLVPVAVVSLYGIATRIGGRLFAYWTLLLWLLVPLFGILYTNQGYHQRYTELLLPQGFGLTAMADFPVMVMTLVSAYFAVRTLFDAQPRLLHGVAAGVAAGAAIAIKPSGALFLPAAGLAYLVARRWRHAGAFALALVPALLTLAFWKWRGFGHLPLLHADGGAQLALGAAGLPLAVGSNLSWPHLSHEFDFLREYFWSGRLIQWVVVAGAVGLGRRSRVALALIGGWFTAYLIARGAYIYNSLQDGSLLRLMIPAFPAFVLMLACVPLVLPRLVRRLRPLAGGFAEPAPRVRSVLLVAGVLLTAVVPFAAIASVGPQRASHPYAAFVQEPAIPTEVDLGLRAQPASDGGVSLTWRAQHPAGAPVFYHVFRLPAGQPQYTYCQTGRAASRCYYTNDTDLGVVRGTEYVDHPGKGAWTYRVGLAASWLNDPAFSDVYLLSTSVRLRVP